MVRTCAYELTDRAYLYCSDYSKQPEPSNPLNYPDTFLKMVRRRKDESINQYTKRLFRVWRYGDYRGMFTRLIESYNRR